VNYPQVSITILNWNGLGDTIECLESLKKISYPNYEVIVVDNGSKGNDAQVLKEQFGDYIYLIRNNKNYGYTGGNNIGIRYALDNSSPDYLLILNNDVVVAPDFLTEMVKVAGGDDQVGLVGPKTYFYDAPNRFWLVWANVDMHKGRGFLVGLGETDEGQYDEVKEVDGYLAGSCLLIKQKLIQKCGLFDEAYFCYWDETDYCFRVREAGYKIVYAPRAKIWHKKPITIKPWYKTLRRRDQGNAPPYPLYFMTRNNFKFMKKHATKAQYRNFLLYFFGCRLWFTTGVSLLYRRRPRELTAFYRGIRDGLLNSEGRSRLYTQD
jgi:GT2 family glycosyltransferase